MMSTTKNVKEHESSFVEKIKKTAETLLENESTVYRKGKKQNYKTDETDVSYCQHKLFYH